MINEHQFEKCFPRLNNRLGKKILMIGIFTGKNTIRQLKEVFMEELKEIFAAIILTAFNYKWISGLICTKINSIPIAGLKPFFSQTISKVYGMQPYWKYCRLLIGIIQVINQVLIIMSIR